jgi:hypothetical protein
MNTTNKNNNTMESARQAIVADLSHAKDRKEGTAAGEKLNEAAAQKPAARSVKFFLVL